MSEASERKKRKWHAIDGPYGWIAVWAAVLVLGTFVYGAVSDCWVQGRLPRALTLLVSPCAMIVVISIVTRYVTYGKTHATFVTAFLVLALAGITTMLLAMVGIVTAYSKPWISFLNVWWVDVFWAVVLFLFLPGFFRQFRSVFKKSDGPSQSSGPPPEPELRDPDS